MNRAPVRLLVIAIAVLLALNILIWRIALTPARPQQPAMSPTLQTATLPLRQTATPSPRGDGTATTRLAAATATPMPARPAMATPQPRPPASATPALLTSFDEIVQATQAGRHNVPFRLVASQQDISKEIQAYLRDSGDLSFSDIQVALRPGAAVITGKARVLNFGVGFAATTTVVVENGRPRLKVLQLDLLGGLVPGLIKDRLIAMIEQSADLPLLADLPVAIARVDIEQGQAVVSGATL